MNTHSDDRTPSPKHDRRGTAPEADAGKSSVPKGAPNSDERTRERRDQANAPGGNSTGGGQDVTARLGTTVPHRKGEAHPDARFQEQEE